MRENTNYNQKRVGRMKELNYASCWNLLGLSSDVENLETDYDEGTTFLAADTGDVYILYQKTWYKL